MLLPNTDQAVVEKSKVTDYLLSPDCPDGRSKAEFFVRLGSQRQEWEVLAEALRTHGAAGSVARVAASLWGTRYAVDGALDCFDAWHTPDNLPFPLNESRHGSCAGR